MRYIAAILFLLSIFTGRSQEVEWAVSEQYPSYITRGNFVTRDNKGNTISVSEGTYNGMGLYLIKYDVHGQKAWEKNFKGTASISSLGVDTIGNIYFTCSIGKITIGDSVYASNNGAPALVVKVGVDGSVKWVKRFPYYPRLSSNTDADDNFICTGAYSGTVSVNNNIFYQNPSLSYNTFLGKFSSNFDCIWFKSNCGTKAEPITMSPDSSIYCSDWYNNKFTVGNGATSTVLTSTIGAYCAKYDKSGNLLWATTVNNGGIQPSSNGNCNILIWSNLGYAYIGRYNSNGVFQDTISRLKLDCYKMQFKTAKDGSMYISGGYGTSLLVNDTTIQSNDNNYHAFVVKFDSEGKRRWIWTAKGPGASAVKDIYINNKEIFITGDIFNGESSMGNTTLYQTEGVFTAKLIDEDKPVAVSDNNTFNTFFEIHPNPSNSGFNLRISSSEINGPFQLRVTDTQGKIVYSDNISEFQGTYSKQINLTGLANGIYFLVLSTSQATEVRKVVIQ